MMRRIAKQGIKSLLFLFLEIYGFLKRKKLFEIKHVGILFCRPLGIGDLVMLSPLIQKIKTAFPEASVTLVTWVPAFIRWEGIDIMSCDDARNSKKQFDIVISPTLALKHIRFMLNTRYWLGYFSGTRSQTNIAGIRTTSYDPRSEHYIWRGIRLLTSVDATQGVGLETCARQKQLEYPSFITTQPSYFDTLENKRYLVVSIFSHWEDRQWPLDRFVEVIKDTVAEYHIDRVVLTGDTSSQNSAMAQRCEAMLQLPPEVVVNTVGKNSLTELAFLIQNSTLFLGVDSGPSHIAYCVAPRAVVLFISCNPALRLPLRQPTRGVQALYLEPKPEVQLYDGDRPVSAAVAKSLAETISVERVSRAIRDVMKI